MSNEEQEEEVAEPLTAPVKETKEVAKLICKNDHTILITSDQQRLTNTHSCHYCDYIFTLDWKGIEGEREPRDIYVLKEDVRGAVAWTHKEIHKVIDGLLQLLKERVDYSGDKATLDAEMVRRHIETMQGNVNDRLFEGFAGVTDHE